MDKQQFMSLLIQHNINPEVVCFNDNIKDDVFCVMDNYKTVDVFYRERGREFELQRFKTQSEALEYLLMKILKISGK